MDEARSLFIAVETTPLLLIALLACLVVGTVVLAAIAIVTQGGRDAEDMWEWEESESSERGRRAP